MKSRILMSMCLLAVVSILLAGCASQPKKPSWTIPIASEEEEATKLAVAGKDSLVAKDYEAAVRLFKESLGKKSDYLDAKKGLAIALKEFGKNQEAIAAHIDVLEMAPDDAQFRAGLAYLYLKSDSLDKAIEEYTIVAKKMPDDDKIYQNLGYIYAKKGALAEALMAYERALELQPKDTDILKTMASLYSEHGMLAEAAGTYDKLMNVDSTDVVTARNYASVCMKLENYPKAVAVYRKVVALDPKSYGDRFFLAVAYQRSKQVDKAALEFETIIAENPEYRGAYCSLAQIYNDKNLPLKAVAVAQKGLQADPNSACLICAWGLALELQTKYEEAIEMFGRAKADPQLGQYASDKIKRQEYLIQLREFEKQKRSRIKSKSQ